MNKSYSAPFFALGAIFLCAQFGSQDSSIAGHKKPKINFYGTLTDTSGNTFNVENITLSGLYKQVPFYAKPQEPKADPAINITRLDLHEIEKVEVPHPDKLLTFNNRQYIEVIVTSADPAHTKNHYIIEKSKRIICDQVNRAGAIEKDLSYQALDNFVIEGHKAPQPVESPAQEPAVEKPEIKDIPRQSGPAKQAPIKSVSEDVAPAA